MGQEKGDCCGVICETVGAIIQLQGVRWGGKCGLKVTNEGTQEGLLGDWCRFYGPVVSKVFLGLGGMVVVSIRWGNDLEADQNTARAPDQIHGQVQQPSFGRIWSPHGSCGEREEG